MNLAEQIYSEILSNQCKDQERLVGIEVECLIYDHELRRIPVNPGSKYSATDLLASLSTWQNDNRKCIHYSIEPGGQVEYASPPIKSLHQAHTQYIEHLEQLLNICQQENLVPLDYALDPLYAPSEVELIAVEKYQLMNNLFAKTGQHGPWMMRNTASVQVNIDVTSQRDAEEMAFIADCLQPLVAILFAHAPFKLGEPAGQNNLRYHIWHDTDPDRCGNLIDHGITSNAGLLEKYINWILRVPVIFAQSGQDTIKYNGTMGNWLQSRAIDGIISPADIQLMLHQIFSHVRFKNVIEVRGADRPLCNHEFAPAAFWLGVLSSGEIRRKMLALVSSWSIETRKQLNQLAGSIDVKQKAPDGRTVEDWIGEICDLARAGLQERAMVQDIATEINFLDDYLKTFFDLGSPALFLQNKFKNCNLDLKEFIKTCEIECE